MIDRIIGFKDKVKELDYLVKISDKLKKMYGWNIKEFWRYY